MQLRGGGEQLTYMRRAWLFAGFLLITAMAAGCGERLAMRNVAKAQSLVQAGKPEEAIRLLDRELPKLQDPKKLSAGYATLAEAFTRIGYVTEAFNAYQKALLIDSHNLAAQQRLIELMIATGNADKAVVLAEGLAAERPNDAKAVALRAQVLSAAGNFTEAESTYRRALTLQPDDSDIVISLAELLLRQERVDEARSLLLGSVERSKKAPTWLALGRLEEQNGNADAAEAAYRSAVASADTVATNRRLAQFLQRASKIDEAQKVLKHVDELSAKAGASADFDMVRGRAAAATQSYLGSLRGLIGASAVSEHESSILIRTIEALLDPSSGAEAKMRAITARALLNQHRSDLDAGTQALLETEIALTAGELDRAAQASERALTYQPESSAARYLRGVVLDQLGERKQALEAWQAAVDKDDHLPSHMMLAAVALARGENDVAEDHIAQVLRDEPANLRALLIYAKVLEREGRFDAAESIVRRARAVDPTNSEAYVIEGTIATSRGSDGAAMLAFEKALLFDQRSRAGVDGLLRVFASGKPRVAMIRKVEAMAAAPPASPTLLEVAGRLYDMSGHKSDAKRALQHALAIDQQRPTTALALWRVDSKDTPSLDTVHSPMLQAAEAEQKGSIDAAVRGYELAIELGDRSAVAANNLAFAYAVRGQKLDRALELSARAVRELPDKPEPMDTLGFVLLKMKQYSAAADAFERALDLKPDAASKRQITLHLADAYEASGLETKAAQMRSDAGAPAAKIMR